MSDSFVFNGVNAISGDYLLPSLTAAEVAQAALGEKLDPQHLHQLKWRAETRRYETYGLQAGTDPTDLSKTGWGIIFAHDASPAIRKELAPLLDHRHAQAGALYKEFAAGDGYLPGEQSWDFLRRWKHAPAGPVDPARIPYYLLIVGEPEEIPYHFQYGLDAQFSVGRIAFDTPQEYARYAASVVRAESGEFSKSTQAAFFGVRNQDDAATQMSAGELVVPLAAAFERACPDWAMRQYVAADATKATLGQLLGGNETPRFLFSASHGMGFPCGHPQQLTEQGALLCQDWPGPLRHHGPIPRTFYFAAEDVTNDANVAGMIAFFFACYGGGTPRLDDFSHATSTDPQPIAPRAFVAGLPKRLLAHPNGGALAIVAHVERAWGYSFSWPGVGPQLQVFESTLKQLAAGRPIGSALEDFNQRYAELAVLLTAQIQQAKFQRNIDALQLAGTWTAHNDARSYVIIGDPAVRII